jgi:hypothetical protein
MASSSAATIAFMKPSVSPSVSMRPTRFIGNFATRTGMPFARVFLAESDAGQGRIGEHTVGDLAARARTTATRQFLPDDPEIVDRDMGELRATSAFAEGPDAGCAGLQPLIHLYEAAFGDADLGFLKPIPLVFGRRPSATRMWASRAAI